MKNESKAKTIFFCIWVLVAFFLILNGAGVPFFVKAAMQAIAVTGYSDMEAYQTEYMRIVNETGVGFSAQILGTGAALLVSAIWFFKGYSKHYSAEEKEESKKYLKNGYIIAAVTFGTLAFYGIDNLLANLITVIAPSTAEQFDSIMSVALNGSPILVFLVVVILGPLNEEFIFRGIILRRSQRAFASIVPVVLIEAVLFGVYHMNILQGIYAAVIGAFFGVIAYKTKSLVLSVYAHMLNNFFASNVMGMVPGEYVNLVTLIGFTLVCGGIAILMLSLFKKKNVVAAE